VWFFIVALVIVGCISVPGQVVSCLNLVSMSILLCSPVITRAMAAQIVAVMLGCTDPDVGSSVSPVLCSDLRL
jgi:hypothetical protein